MSAARCFVVWALFVSLLSACAFSRQVNIRSHPAGAEVWLEGEPLGYTPTTARAKTTGSLRNLTFDPEFVTFELEGYERTVRPLDYRWSERNVAWSILSILGLPGIIWWGKEPVDLWVDLTSESEETVSGGL
jgi:hypothetical protein